MRWAAGVAAAALGFAAAGSADATIITATYAGTVTQGVDIFGDFGAAGSNLTGKAFTATYVYDNTIGYVGPDKNLGGYATANPLPVTDVTVTINGRTDHVVFNFAFMQIGAGVRSGKIENIDTTADVSEYAPPVAAEVLGLDVPKPMITSVSSAETIIKSGSPNNYGGSLLFLSSTAVLGGLNFDVQSLSVDTALTTYLSPIPEPSSWSAMILGAALIGSALRRRPKLA